MPKRVGLSRNLKTQWLDKAVELLSEELSEEEYKKALNEYLSFDIASATNLRKTREILLNIWFYDDDEINDLRTKALALLEKHPDYSLTIQWCMLLVVYPVFADVSRLIGRTSDFQDDIVLAQIKQKLFDEWGERSTLFHSVDKIIASMRGFGVLQTVTPGTYHIRKQSLNIDEVLNFVLLVSMIVGKKSYYTFSELTNMDVLFPFEYRINREQISADRQFEINTFGGEITVALNI